MGSGVDDPLRRLAALDGLAEAVSQARTACERLRWHSALRRHADACHAEAGVRAARCSAALEGAGLPVDLVRDAVRGAGELPADATGRVVLGAIRVGAQVDALTADGGRLLTAAPWQAFARLHVAAAAGLLEAAALGRPRRSGEPPGDVPAGSSAPGGPELTLRLEALGSLLAGRTAAPAAVTAAIAHGELLALRPFPAGNGVVARAVARAIVVGRGLDPTGVAVPEAAHLADVPGYAAAHQGYVSGTPAGMAHWLRHCCRAVAAGADEGRRIGDAALAGRLSRS